MGMGAGLLHDKVILITGAASGIGAAAAAIAAREGAMLCLADIDLNGVEQVAGELRGQGHAAIAVSVDVASEASVTAMVASAVGTYGRLDGAFNNAGIGTFAMRAVGKRLHEIETDGWNLMIATNLSGVWQCMKQALAVMKAGGSIVNTASVAGLVGMPAAAAYVAAKHGVVGLTKAAAIDYGPSNIRVNAICPGYVETPLVRHADAAKRESIAGMKPLGRFAGSNEIAESVVWLLSDRSSFTTGAAVAVDGGYTAR